MTSAALALSPKVEKSDYRLVMTGGPCAGKTTAMAKIAEWLQSLGLRTLIVPEVATNMLNGGLTFKGATPTQIFERQAALLGLQIRQEEAYRRVAASYPESTVILIDRGSMDAAAYVPAGMWQALLDTEHHKLVDLRDARYHGVVHLVTAADGAEAFYTFDNNRARTETPAEARTLDQKIQAAWIGHPHLRVISNEGNFEQKIKRAMQEICRVIGIPEPLEFERKFLVGRRTHALPVPSVTVQIQQIYTLSGRIRRRSQYDGSLYTRTVKTFLGPGKNTEKEKIISPLEFDLFQLERDPKRRPVNKERMCFLWRGQYYELDTFIDPRPGQQQLELELHDEESQYTLPPFLEIEKEVTGDPAYSNAMIALE